MLINFPVPIFWTIKICGMDLFFTWSMLTIAHKGLRMFRTWNEMKYALKYETIVTDDACCIVAETLDRFYKTLASVKYKIITMTAPSHSGIYKIRKS